MAKHLFKSKKAQIFTFDLSSSIIIFVLFVAAFIGLFLASQSPEKKQEFELEYVFANLENNLREGAVTNPNTDFFTDYMVSRQKLENFASLVGTSSIDDYIIGQVDSAHGIGLDSAGYDCCLYFTDNDGSRISLNSETALGRLDKTGTSCEYELTNNNNPCEHYSQAISIFKPVLFDEADINHNRIVQMNLVICKK